jgi:hypothetical protein
MAVKKLYICLCAARDKSHGDFAAEVLRDVVLDPQDNIRLREVEPDDWGFGTTKKDKKKNRFTIAVL